MPTAIEIAGLKHALRAQMNWPWRGKHARRWHGLPQGILGLGFGVKRKDGQISEHACVRVYIRSKAKKARDRIGRKWIPEDVEGYPTAVIEVNEVRAHASPGGSIGNDGVLSGTLGCVVSDAAGSYLLSAWHVLANVAGKDGDPVFMPSRSQDGQSPLVGRLIATPKFHLNSGSNLFDASVARMEPGTNVGTTIDGLGPLVLPAIAATLSMAVRKQGVATGLTNGEIDGIDEEIGINYNGDPNLHAVLTGQIAIASAVGPFSDEGDSGALVCTGGPDLRPIGLIVAGSNGTQNPTAHSFASPLQPILDFYQVAIQP
jgi:hypothetical protein